MARTFIGELIFRFKDDASAKAQQTAKNIGGSVESIERAAKRLNTAPLGGRLQRDLEKLGASSSDLDKLRVSWERLHSSMASRNLSAAARRAEIANFEIATRGHFAAITSASKAQFKDMETRTRAFSGRLQAIMKPALVMMGGYTGAYVLGMGGRAGFTAASNEQRERARQHFAGLPTSEQDQIESQSQDLASKYRVNQADVMELMREARLAMPSAAAAFGVAEELVQTFKVLGLRQSPEEAVSGLRVLMKALDNLAMTEDPAAITSALQAFLKAQQITGKDMDPGEMAQAIKYARSSGKVFSEDFLFKWMPFMIAEVGGSDTGTQLRAGFDQFVVGRASKKSLAAQREYGLRDGDNRLVGQDEFAANPVKWVNDYVLPALEKNGVKRDDEVEMARVVGELTNNRLSSDLILRLIENFKQYQRQVELAEKAIGLEGAKDLDSRDAYSAFAGFTTSLQNLAGAVLPMKEVSAGLIGLSDGVNALQLAFRNGNPLAQAGLLGGAAAGAYGAWKVSSMVWGLMTAGTNLNLAAASLETAAVSLGGAGVADALPGGGGKKRGWLGALGALSGTAGVIVGSGLLQSGSSRDMTPEEKAKVLADGERQWSVLQERRRMEAENRVAAQKRYEANEAKTTEGFNTFHGIVGDAQKTGQDVKDALSVTAKPTVDKSDLQATLALINQIKSGLSGLGATIVAEQGRIQREMNRNFADHGVAP